MPAPPERSSGGSPPVITPARVVIGLCLFVPFVAVLWVSSYARVEPTFIGLPFFYWYQMLWVFISAGLTMIAYRLVQREQAKRRAAQREDGAR
ncbi:MAG: DUF3311 domain-containing protein [Streptomyces sp.]|uniref:DUF3311 domain-containing protein n=1 Tax=Streptomyces sp. TaxID=1931 RepID=UPI003D6B8940